MTDRPLLSEEALLVIEVRQLERSAVAHRREEADLLERVASVRAVLRSEQRALQHVDYRLALARDRLAALREGRTSDGNELVAQAAEPGPVAGAREAEDPPPAG